MGKPRLDAYERLLFRFYEVLILLSLVRKVVGSHVLTNLDNASITAYRRRFIRNLAFICDHDKGGDATTSVAIESRPDCFMFWVASNKEPRRQTIDFLKSILAQLKRIPTLRSSETRKNETHIARRCAEFSKSRIKKERKILANAAKKCEGTLKSTTLHAITADRLTLWLQKFKFDEKVDSLQACETAYEARNDPQMQTLRNLGQESHADTGSTGSVNPFRTVTHVIGRLAEHIRVAKQLLDDSARLAHLIDVCDVDSVKFPECVPPPEADSQTTLDGIVKRMLPAKDPSYDDFRNYLARMDFEDRIKDVYEKHKSKPRVHSEMQMHEHFYRNGLEFADDDLFIGTSKFSCYCCKLYFRHHPAGYLEPDSHQKVYLNWGPIVLPQGTKDPLFEEQRDVMNLIRKDLSDVTSKQIQRQRISSTARPDSITGITSSEIELFEDVYEFSDLEDEFLSDGEIGEDTPHTSEDSNGYLSGRDGGPSPTAQTPVDRSEESDGGVKL